MILHIPHASTQTLEYILNNKERELLRMTDWYTDDLYDCPDTTKIIFGLSRLICDVERFEDDEHEPMSRFGMGVCYTTDTEGNLLRDLSNPEREKIITNHYRPHHQSLCDAVDKELQTNDFALIIDCHSFPDVSYYFNSDYQKRRPDVCIGTDSYHTPPELTKLAKDFFSNNGYKVQVDDPYHGTMVPLKHYHNDKRVHSIMIEINRKLYMEDDGTKNEYYDTVKDDINESLQKLQKMDLCTT